MVSINQVMVALVDHAAHHLWDLGRAGAAPETDRDWIEVEQHAIQLAAGASWIATGGAGQADAGWVAQLPWKRYATQVSQEAVAALEAARAKDLEGVLAAGDALIEACEGCHREFKPDLPTEGVVHPHIYEPRVQ
jgi:cytochrome c556